VRPHSVEEGAKTLAVEVVLDVPRVEVIEQIENTESNAALISLCGKRERYRPGYLHVEGIEAAIARSRGADEVAGLVATE